MALARTYGHTQKPPRFPSTDLGLGDDDIAAIKDEDDEPQLPPKLEQAIVALQTANPALSREDAAWFLLHNPHGRALVEHLSKQQHPTMQKGNTMTREAELQSILKAHGGITAMAKLFVATGKPLGNVTEAEFAKLIDDEAQKTRKAGERPNTAFSRYYNDPSNVELRKAHQLTRGF